MIAVVGIIPKVIIETILIIAIILSIFYFLQINNTNYSEYISIAGTLLAAAYKISPSITKIMNSFQSIKILSNTIDHLKKKIKGSFSKTKKRKDNIYNFKNKLVFNNINLDLGNNKLFANLNLKIKKGSFNAIVGDSGKGKTSIFNLIMGLIEPTKGKILIDNKNIKSILSEWQNSIGYAPQVTFLYKSTVLKNIVMGQSKSEIDFVKLENAFKMSGLNRFLNFRKDLNKIILEKGGNFSVGQVQRFGIARAIYFGSKILLLDEITISLDLKSEEKIIDDLKKIKKQFTIIFITHRNNNLNKFDNIINLNKIN